MPSMWESSAIPLAIAPVLLIDAVAGESGSLLTTTPGMSLFHDNHTSPPPPPEHEPGVHLAAWNFDYVAEPLIISIFILVAGILKLAFHYAHFLSSVIPESCLLIIVGTAFDGILYLCGLDDLFVLNPRTFMLFLLPPIILDSAYSLNDRVFAENIGTILLYAVIGTILSFLMLGPTLWGLHIGNAMGDIVIDGEVQELRLVDSFLFASFIVAVDPVAVLAIFEEVGVNNVLYFLVFGESLLNDAVTVVLSNMMKEFVRMETVPWEQVVLGILSFFTISLGGLAIGIIMGICTALFTRLTRQARVVEPMAVLILAYLSYICAELFHWSGIISMIGCGLIQSQYAFHNISRKSYITVKYFSKMFSGIMDAIIFLFLGLELISSSHFWHTGFTLWAMFYCLVYRLITVFGLSLLANLFRSQKVGIDEQFTMWYGGLRGAVCFALCDTIHEGFPFKQMFLTSTLFVILFTVFIQGTTIKPLVTLCKVRRKEEGAMTMCEEVNNRVIDHTMTGLECIIQQMGTNRFRAWLLKMDHQYFSRWLQNDPLTHDQRILKVYGHMAMKDYEANIHLDYIEQKQVYLDGSKWFLTKAEEEEDLITTHGMDSAEFRHRMRTISSGMPGQDSPRSTVRFRRRSPRTDEGEVNTVSELSALLRQTRPATMALHQRYDPGLVHDDQLDLAIQLQERHFRVERLKLMRVSETSQSEAVGRDVQRSKRATIAAMPDGSGHGDPWEAREAARQQWKRATVAGSPTSDDQTTPTFTPTRRPASLEALPAPPSANGEEWHEMTPRRSSAGDRNNSEC